MINSPARRGPEPRSCGSHACSPPATMVSFGAPPSRTMAVSISARRRSLVNAPPPQMSSPRVTFAARSTSMPRAMPICVISNARRRCFELLRRLVQAVGEKQALRGRRDGHALARQLHAQRQRKTPRHHGPAHAAGLEKMRRHLRKRRLAAERLFVLPGELRKAEHLVHARGLASAVHLQVAEQDRRAAVLFEKQERVGREELRRVEDVGAFLAGGDDELGRARTVGVGVMAGRGRWRDRRTATYSVSGKMYLRNSTSTAPQGSNRARTSAAMSPASVSMRRRGGPAAASSRTALHTDGIVDGALDAVVQTARTRARA